MGREVRMVPANWEHPQYTADNAPFERSIGRYIPLLGGSYTEAAREFLEMANKGSLQEAIDYYGEAPKEDDYMPDWPEVERTHLMMYENTSEGTPISPAFKTPEELALWLSDNGASTFADMTATYDQWLVMINRGWAISAVMTGGEMKSGVEAM